ncbi:hypothetical protein BH24ACT19_BH24ACT19_02060 [soil metagenome]
MSTPNFYIVDVFAEEKYVGSPSSGEEPDATLQRIAAEVNYSETTFIVSEEECDGGYDARIFTPREESPSPDTRRSGQHS